MEKKLISFSARCRYICVLLIFSFTVTHLFAQSPTVITGKVLAGKSDTAVIGASVHVKGTNSTVITNADGVFKVNASPNATLVISAIGYANQDFPLSGNNNVMIRLVSTAEELQQVIVIGYGTQKKRDLTGAVSSVNAATIEKVPVVSASQALQGRAAGVQVTSNDAAPGGNISVLIRGTGSLASYGNEPLYVVDGYPVSTGINSINPNDIATIDVLKDASSTAIYGIRAANGVVIITTKKGVKGKVQISIDAYNAFQSKPKKYDLLNAQQFATLSNDVEAADSTHSYHGMAIWHTPDALHSVDWQDALYGAGLTQSYNLGIRGGSDKMQSAMSVGYFDQKGIALGSYFKRLSLSLNLDYQPVKWLRSSTSVKYANQDANTPIGTGSLYQLYVNPPTLDSGNRKTYQIKDGNGNYGFYNPIDPNVYKFSNPVYTVETNKYKNITNYILGSSSLEATIYDGLKIKTNAGVNITDLSSSYYQPEDDRANEQFPAAVITKAYYHQNTKQVMEWLWENTLSYDKTFGRHTVNFVGGISAQKNTTTLMGGGGIPPNGTVRDLAQVSNLVLDASGNGENIYTFESQFGRLSYNYAEKYFVTGTVRRDGSSKFDEGHKYGVFPSGAVAWRAKQESFLRDVNWLTDLKFRGSYGELGNQSAIGLFQYEALYAGNFAQSYNGGGLDNFGYPFDKLYQNGIAPVQPANPDLKWETDYETDIGMDATFLKGALTFTFDWYKRKSKDFLLNLAAPAQTGFTSLTRNVGSMENTGAEFAVNYNGNSGRDFHYNIGLTLTTNKNTLTSITSGTDYVQNFGGLTLTGTSWDEYTRSKVGGPVGEFYGYKALGIFQSQAQIDALNAKAPNGVYWRGSVQPGDRYYADVNGDGMVSADSDRVALGNPQPKFYGGLNFDFTYKAWDFNLYFYGSYGNKILNYTESNLESFQKRGSEGVENVSENYYNNRWTSDHPSNRYAQARAVDDAIGNNLPSSVWVENGSFIKLKNLMIGYTLPSSLLSKINIQKLRVYVSSQNLFTITKYTGLDPEIGVQNGNATQNGVDNGTYPSSRFFTVGLNVSF
jgi:TonB-linked SusC/RagA family outer membrane protein